MGKVIFMSTMTFGTALNQRGPHYEWPGPNSLIWVVAVSRVHILERDDYGHDFVHRAVRMCCGLNLVNIRPTIWTVSTWDTSVEWTKKNPPGVLQRVQGNVRPACLECDQAFNQSEIAV